MKKIGLHLMLIFVVATAANGQRTKSTILPPDEAKKTATQCSRPSPSDFTDTWIPSKDQIDKMESRFPNISKLRAKSCCIEGARIENPNDWYMQYAALVWKGRKIIYISAISTKEPEKGLCFDKNGVVTDEKCEFWKAHAWIVCDGGTNWGVVYDVLTGKFSELAVNGVG